MAEPTLSQWTVDAVRALRRANLKASNASEQWNKLNAEWNQMADDNGWHDIVDRTKRKGENLPLKAAMDTWSFWEREAKRHADSILAEVAARKLLAFAQGDITVGQL